MRAVRAPALLFLLCLGPLTARAAADELSLRNEKNLSPEQCLALPANEVATRCPGMGGRLITVGAVRYALVERYEPKRSTSFCDEGDGHWRCRRVVVIDRELRGTRRRNPQAFITAGELLRTIATAPSLKVADELGALFAGAERRRTCVEIAKNGCAVQAVRLKVAGATGAPVVKRRLWLVEDADGPMLQCSDYELTRCDALDAAGWLAMVVTLRPSSQAPPAPTPELDVPDVRADKRPPPKDGVALTAAEAVDTPAGALDPYVRPKLAKNLPKSPSRADATRLAQAIDRSGRACVAADRATVELTLTGEGNVLALAVDGAQSGGEHDCLVAMARKLPLPRFADATWHVTALVRKK
ncbi:MAG: hypothetical protein JWN44_441 [Myxococcales bacterium]|nr:hypothetical protein [Myxococcales bacterium]